jgi:hypothetical protein
MANEFVIKNGFFSQGSSNVTGNLTVSQTISGTTAQFTNLTSSVVTGTTGLFTNLTASVVSASNAYGGIANFNQITASFVNFLNVTGTYSGNGSYLTNITASALNDTTGTFAVQGIQDGQYLKRVGNLIVGTFFVGSVLVIPEDVNVLTCGISASDSITTAYVFNGSAV